MCIINSALPICVHFHSRANKRIALDIIRRVDAIFPDNKMLRVVYYDNIQKTAILGILDEISEQEYEEVIRAFARYRTFVLIASSFHGKERINPTQDDNHLVEALKAQRTFHH